ncbi:hypothetical protein BLNAU_8221 [Blattamonas nauphoetae]|uniref:Uncharacterized protein n=1 Tax=Blattamonas nauphoetae TaxID=2049346 RepID=A0ABQ9XZ75_9EUKA|nr:hypothetical protein BLNAU_8221 [Blattamonas nauphoetae]
MEQQHQFKSSEDLPSSSASFYVDVFPISFINAVRDPESEYGEIYIGHNVTLTYSLPDDSGPDIEDDGYPRYGDLSGNSVLFHMSQLGKEGNVQLDVPYTISRCHNNNVRGHQDEGVHISVHQYQTDRQDSVVNGGESRWMVTIFFAEIKFRNGDCISRALGKLDSIYGSFSDYFPVSDMPQCGGGLEIGTTYTITSEEYRYHPSTFTPVDNRILTGFSEPILRGIRSKLIMNFTFVTNGTFHNSLIEGPADTIDPHLALIVDNSIFIDLVVYKQKPVLAGHDVQNVTIFNSTFKQLECREGGELPIKPVEGVANRFVVLKASTVESVEGALGGRLVYGLQASFLSLTKMRWIWGSSAPRFWENVAFSKSIEVEIDSCYFRFLIGTSNWPINRLG